MEEDAIHLTIHEQEQARQQAIRLMRARLEAIKPQPDDEPTNGGQANRLITSTLVWAKAFVPLIALLAALASAVRTIQTASEIYTASGSHPIGVAIAAIAFTFSVEGALFVLALAREGERLALRAQRKQRHVLSLKSLIYALQVRVGLREPLRYDQLPEHSSQGAVMLIAFLFAVMANLYALSQPISQPFDRLLT